MRIKCEPRSVDVIRLQILHEVLVPGLAELDQVWFDAVHLLVDLSVVGGLFLQVDLQVTFTVHDLTDPRLQLVVVLHDPEKMEGGSMTSGLYFSSN